MSQETILPCGCMIDNHIQALSKYDENLEVQDFPEESADREWQAHTAKYRESWEKMFDKVSGDNCQVGEMRLAKWEQKNHVKLCCKDRHANQLLMFNTFEP
jgi:hypothetical protein